MINPILYLLVSYFVFLAGLSHEPAHNLPPAAKNKITTLYLPKYGSADDVYHYKGFSLCYREQYELAAWVAYEITPDELLKNTKASPRFIPDSLIKSGTATDADYKGSGYDRGHLAAAADMRWSERALEESYFYSNVVPQNRSLNKGRWKSLEEKIRHWVTQYGPIQVVTGPIFSEKMRRIGPNKVAVPQWYFKAIVAEFKGEYIAAAYILPNTKSNNALSVYMVTIDEIEKKTGLDLFHKLPDSIEKDIESTITRKYWK